MRIEKQINDLVTLEIAELMKKLSMEPFTVFNRSFQSNHLTHNLATANGYNSYISIDSKYPNGEPAPTIWEFKKYLEERHDIFISSTCQKNIDDERYWHVSAELVKDEFTATVHVLPSRLCSTNEAESMNHMFKIILEDLLCQKR